MVEIKNVNGHYEVYKDGEFWCSADTRHEAEQDIGVNKMIIGTWWSDDNIELVKINEKIYALDGWNGEKYLHCWECADRFSIVDSNIEYEIKPIYNSDGSIDFEIF